MSTNGTIIFDVSSSSGPWNPRDRTIACAHPHASGERS
eukprot:CAMPEP_0119509730 /NCGR_PEP_ID=MMETSP1344-20130328/28922_1 /TAXON_ID=236787 /ORGANISM="Florenciella parvula, Strain CCMP2471" /LENGTH=37 /DNA_ID= /DNA_START= /DNA_END= /DNA_ORIENTATION=